MNFLKQFLSQEDGISAIEYAVLAAIIIGLLVTVFTGNDGISSVIEQTFNAMKTALEGLNNDSSSGN
ncbi:Flp family type IVb pilin [Thalassotalea euphylliae]|uniref:Flp family type IVb pilin n=1 Tax=Thalassotalea euphylliae TaxID=1655234 RepID=A0A3E0TN19_9GAMM|nr:Flp family type IVb pilin [Thalassotalea euphylliae]REL25946.1 Flp family type IVb pilin [Thalassotalea euphylliae]